MIITIEGKQAEGKTTVVLNTNNPDFDCPHCKVGLDIETDQIGDDIHHVICPNCKKYIKVRQKVYSRFMPE